MTGKLKPTLGTIHLWGIAVGLVISGEYFGWSYGWGVAGTLGFLVTTALIALMYTCFIFSFCSAAKFFARLSIKFCTKESAVIMGLMHSAE